MLTTLRSNLAEIHSRIISPMLRTASFTLWRLTHVDVQDYYGHIDSAPLFSRAYWQDSMRPGGRLHINLFARLQRRKPNTLPADVEDIF